MKEATGKGIQTLCVHGGHQGEARRAHLTPIYASSTYTFDAAEQAEAIFQGKEEGFVYGRFGNPTIREAEEKIALLEAFGLLDDAGNPLQLKAILHASGMAAITTMLLSNLKAGDKIITHLSLYGGTQELLDKVLPALQIGAVIVDFDDEAAVARAIQDDPAIRMMYLETPANPTIRCTDLEKFTALAKQHGLIVCADNTFATPLWQQPFRYGVDYVMHSTTKFLNGHGTALGGIVIGRDIDRMNTVVTKTHRLLGGNSNGFDAFLLTNGLRTLPLRLKQHGENAMAVAHFLNTHAAVAKVNYLGLPEHPHYAIAQKQMKHPGAMLSFELTGGVEAGRRFINALQLCTSAVSLGTCDTLVSHPASTTHVGVPRDKRMASGITDGLIRMSVGIEDVADIVTDLEQALQQAM